MSVIKEFREFAARGNVVDLAVGVIIGGAFGKIVSVLVDKILTPPLGLLIGGMDFSHLRLILKSGDPDGRGEVAIGYGEFIQAVVNFLIVAWALFLVIKAMNTLMRDLHADQRAVPSPPPPENVVLLREIRDLLKK